MIVHSREMGPKTVREYIVQGTDTKILEGSKGQV